MEISYAWQHAELLTGPIVDWCIEHFLSIGHISVESTWFTFQLQLIVDNVEHCKPICSGVLTVMWEHFLTLYVYSIIALKELRFRRFISPYSHKSSLKKNEKDRKANWKHLRKRSLTEQQNNSSIRTPLAPCYRPVSFLNYLVIHTKEEPCSLISLFIILCSNFWCCFLFQGIITDGPIFLTRSLECPIITPTPSQTYAVSTVIVSLYLICPFCAIIICFLLQL